MTEFDEAAVERVTGAFRHVRARTWTSSRGWRDLDATELAALALDAIAEPPKPKWPTDGSLDFFLYATGEPLRTLPSDTPEHVRNTLRAAFLADPIIKAAVALASNFSDGPPRVPAARALYDAVLDAGLLDGER